MVLTSVNAKMLHVNIVIVAVLFLYMYDVRCMFIFFFFCNVSLKNTNRQPKYFVKMAYKHIHKHTLPVWLACFLIRLQFFFFFSVYSVWFWKTENFKVLVALENVQQLTIHTNHQLIENFSPAATITEVFTSKVSIKHGVVVHT